MNSLTAVLVKGVEGKPAFHPRENHHQITFQTPVVLSIIKLVCIKLISYWGRFHSLKCSSKILHTLVSYPAPFLQKMPMYMIIDIK